MALDMNIDLKNINLSDLKDKILKLADKKTLIKIGIIFGAIVFFLISLINSWLLSLIMNRKFDILLKR